MHPRPVRLAAAGVVGASARLARRRRPPRRPGASRAAPLALVTADLDGFVAVVDLERRRVVRRIATLDGPRSIEAGAGGAGALVGHAALGVVTLLPRRRPGVRRVLGGFGEPRYAAIAPGGGHAFVTDSGHGELAVVDLRAGRVVRRVEVGAGARHLTLDPRGRTLWIALGSTAAELVVVDVADPLAPRVVRRIAPPFGAHDVAFSPSGRRVWVTGGRTPRVALYGARGGAAPRAPPRRRRRRAAARDVRPARRVRRQRRGPLAHRPRARRRPAARGGAVTRWAATTSRAAPAAC